ncbi:MAG: SDR family NAD(P)-dependent oxidoreductase [Acidimicrobiia bacterium]
MSQVADIVDQVLEVPIAPSFSRLGPIVRSRLDHWNSEYDVTAKVIVITGATSGLGLTAAQQLAAAGARIEVVARNPKKAADVCTQLNAEIPGSAASVTADMGDLDSVRSAASELLTRHDHIDTLIHCAGALDSTYGRSPQGIEQTVASQVVGPFLLTGLLLDALRSATAPRVVWVSSGGMYSQPLTVDRLEMTAADYDGSTAYARAKRAQVTLAEMWAQRTAADGIQVHAMHPGWADTPGVARSLPTFRKLMGPLLRTTEEGADTLVWLAASDELPPKSSGSFWLDRRPRGIHRLKKTRESDTPTERRALWDWCEAQSGWTFPPSSVA